MMLAAAVKEEGGGGGGAVTRICTCAPGRGESSKKFKTSLVTEKNLLQKIGKILAIETEQ
jgi:hypothetical protein